MESDQIGKNPPLTQKYFCKRTNPIAAQTATGLHIITLFMYIFTYIQAPKQKRSQIKLCFILNINFILKSKQHSTKKKQ